MSLAILFHLLCTEHVSDINISIIRSLRLCCWITASVVLFSVRCVLEIWCGWVWVVSVLQASACNMDTTWLRVIETYASIFLEYEVCRYGWGALCSKFGRGQRLNSVGGWRPLLSGAASQIRACWLRRERGLPRTAKNIHDLRTNTRPGLRCMALTPQKNWRFCQKSNFAFIGRGTFHFASNGEI